MAFGSDPLHPGLHPEIFPHAQKPLLGHLGLEGPDVLGGVKDLAVKVRGAYPVRINQDEASDPDTGQALGHKTP